jgi:AcrR family transcriptional regulator
MTPSSEDPKPAAPKAVRLPQAPQLPRRRDPPGRRTALTLDGIVAAAIDVLDEGGVEALSMRQVAQRLGTGAGSLYAHVSSKEQLLELVYDELIGRVQLLEPDPAIWREQATEMLTELYIVLRSHRDAALAGLGRIPTSPNALVGAEALVAVLRAGGLTDRVVALGLDQLTLCVTAAAFEAGLYERNGMTTEEIAHYFDDVHDFYNRLPAASFPVLASIADDMTGPGEEERFQFGLATLIAGLEALSDSEKAARQAE